MRAWHPLKRFLQRYTKHILVAIIVVLASLWILSSLKIIISELWANILSTIFIALALIFTIAQWQPSFKSTKAQENMGNAINEYESTRHHTSPARERNTNMERIMMGMQSQAQQADYSPKDIKRYLGSKREGDRIAGLAILQWLETVNYQHINYFEEVLSLVKAPISPFEHYQALKMLKNDEIWSRLNHNQREDLREAICNYASDSNTSDQFLDFKNWVLQCSSKTC